METHTAHEMVARNVRRVRELRDMRQAALARSLGWSKQTLSKLETGARNVTVDDVLSLALALHVAPAVLMTPWEDDERLVVAVRRGDAHLDSAEAFGWIVGAPDPGTLALLANPVDYFSTTPAAVQRRYGTGWLREVREALGWEVSDDGRQVRKPGISVSWGRED